MLNKTLALIVLAVTSSGFAQLSSDGTAVAAKAPSLLTASSLATIACQSTFNFGSGIKLMNFCVTANGNILGFTAPQGSSQEFAREGYGVCDTTGNLVSYTDEAANDTGNWLNPTISQPNGRDTFPLTITRLTSDGVWQLKQTFSRNTADRYVKVVMALTNKTAIARSASLIRYMDVDADGSGTGDIFDTSRFSSWGYTSADGDNHGVTLAALPSPFSDRGFAASAGGYDACGASGSINSTPFNGDGAIMYIWVFSSEIGTSIAAGATKTVTFEYRAM